MKAQLDKHFVTSRATAWGIALTRLRALPVAFLGLSDKSWALSANGVNEQVPSATPIATFDLRRRRLQLYSNVMRPAMSHSRSGLESSLQWLHVKQHLPL